MKPLIFPLYAATSVIKNLSTCQQFEIGHLDIHEFPDQETYIRILSNVKGREVIFLATLNKPNKKIVPLLFALETARELGATSVGLVVPYLAYMRQDKRFQEGEGITSKYLAKLLSARVDWLVTLDPHLHRYHSMRELYPIPVTTCYSTKPIASWIKTQVNSPIIIGPDKESEQWIAEIANLAEAPYVILQKVRNSAWEVDVTLPDLAAYNNHAPVLVDDIISTGRTMLAAIKKLQELQMPASICLSVHAVFAENAFMDLQQATINRVVTCNTIEHPTNDIDISSIIIDAIQHR